MKRHPQRRQVSASVIQHQSKRRGSLGSALSMLGPQPQAKRRRPRMMQKAMSAMMAAMTMVMHNSSAEPARTPQYWQLLSHPAGASLDVPRCAC